MLVEKSNSTSDDCPHGNVMYVKPSLMEQSSQALFIALKESSQQKFLKEYIKFKK